MRFLFVIILYKILGWSIDITVPQREKCIMCVAPHTSNWDFIMGLLYERSKGMHAHFLMKKEWFFWPLGCILRWQGGIPIDRSAHQHLTEYLSDLIKKASHFQIAITPEGTRSYNNKWKKGFYFIAQKANIPIQLYAIDYSHKKIICKKELVPCGDLEQDFKEIASYYKSFEGLGKYAHKFSIDETI